MKNEALPLRKGWRVGRCAREVFHQHSSLQEQTDEKHVSWTFKSAVMDSHPLLTWVSVTDITLGLLTKYRGQFEIIDIPCTYIVWRWCHFEIVTIYLHWLATCARSSKLHWDPDPQTLTFHFSPFTFNPTWPLQFYSCPGGGVFYQESRELLLCAIMVRSHLLQAAVVS